MTCLLKKAFLFVLCGVVILMAMHLAFLDNQAHADSRGCERIRWGFLASGYRTICDGPRLPDGSWMRERREWTPAGYVPGYCSYYTCRGGYNRAESTQSWQTYPVTDATIVPGEPGHLPAGSIDIH